jgi:hypothetical protein
MAIFADRPPASVQIIRTANPGQNAAVSGLGKEFGQTPKNVALAFTLDSAALSRAAQVEQ